MPVKLKNKVSFIWIAVPRLSWSMRSDRSCWRQKECKEVEMQKEFKWKQDKSFLRDMYLLRAMWYGYHRKLPMLCKQKQYISWVVAKKKVLVLNMSFNLTCKLLLQKRLCLFSITKKRLCFSFLLFHITR